MDTSKVIVNPSDPPRKAMPKPTSTGYVIPSRVELLQHRIGALHQAMKSYATAMETIERDPDDFAQNLQLTLTDNGEPTVTLSALTEAECVALCKVIAVIAAQRMRTLSAEIREFNAELEKELAANLETA